MTNSTTYTPTDDPFGQHYLVAAVIEEAEIDMVDEGILDDEAPKVADTVIRFIEATRATAPYASGYGPPNIEFDIANESNWSSVVSHRNGTVHLHPRLTDTMLLLTITADWLTPGHARGPRYCRVLLTLVEINLGDEAADILDRAFYDFGINVLPDDGRAA